MACSKTRSDIGVERAGVLGQRLEGLGEALGDAKNRPSGGRNGLVGGRAQGVEGWWRVWGVLAVVFEGDRFVAFLSLLLGSKGSLGHSGVLKGGGQTLFGMCQ